MEGINLYLLNEFEEKYIFANIFAFVKTYRHWYRLMQSLSRPKNHSFYMIYPWLPTWRRKKPIASLAMSSNLSYDDTIKWKHFPRYWPFVRGIHRSPVNSPHKGEWRGALMYSFISVWINGWVNNREAGDLRRHRAHYDVIVMNSDHSRRKIQISLSVWQLKLPPQHIACLDR